MGQEGKRGEKVSPCLAGMESKGLKNTTDFLKNHLHLYCESEWKNVLNSFKVFKNAQTQLKLILSTVDMKFWCCNYLFHSLSIPEFANGLGCMENKTLQPLSHAETVTSDAIHTLTVEQRSIATYLVNDAILDILKFYRIELSEKFYRIELCQRGQFGCYISLFYKRFLDFKKKKSLLCEVAIIDK